MSNVLSFSASCGTLTASLRWVEAGCSASHVVSGQQPRSCASFSHCKLCDHRLKDCLNTRTPLAHCTELYLQTANSEQHNYIHLRSFMVLSILGFSGWLSSSPNQRAPEPMETVSHAARSFFKNPENQKRLDEFEASAKGSGHDYRARRPVE